MRRIAAIATLGLLGAVGQGDAQYFGRNQVQYRNLEFSVIETEHFDVHYYDQERDAAVSAARMLERAYARFSRILGHRYRERQPVILFQSHSEFQQNNISPVDEATGGFTEFLRHRMLLPFTGSMPDFQHVLEHELAHQFQIDIFARGRIGAGVQRLIAVNPPLWFMEGMAEYLSSGPITPQTAVWVRDAAIERGLPDLDELTYDPSYFPYRFGHAFWSYVAERWGDEAIGEILHAAGAVGIEPAFRRVLGTDLEDVVEQWHDAIQRTYLPQIADLQQARHVGRPLLTKTRSKGTVHISPAISPDGQHIVYLSEGSSYFIDLYLADAESGRPIDRLIRSAFSTDFESLRFLNSVGSWSPDGRLFAFAAQRGGRDDLVIFDIERRRVHRRIPVALAGLTTPSWSPDGSRLVFTGYQGGYSDLYVVDSSGANLHQLTHDPHADLHPAWSPDGRTIAFVTDRGPETDLGQLRFGPLAVALYHMSDQRIDVLRGMEGANLNPQWAPDGESIAFVSDRSGIPNLYLYELVEEQTYQLTNVFTGVTGVTPLSPVISWSAGTDRLVFTYFERNGFNVYGIDNPRALKGDPWDPTALRPTVASLLSSRAYAPQARTKDDATHRIAGGADTPDPTALEGARPKPLVTSRSFYRTAGGLRVADSLAAGADSAPALPSVVALLDSLSTRLPDADEFTVRAYRARLSPDYVVQPTVGYVRDNFGSGLYGGTAISLSDMLGNHRTLFAGQINGRIDEAQILVAYANLTRRVNWAVGIAQTPYFYFTDSGFMVDSAGAPALVTRLERYVVRDAFVQAHRPFNRFRRLELGLRAAHVDRDAVIFRDAFDPTTGALYDTNRETINLGTAGYIQPSIALVFDNSVSLWVGPFMGRRSRVEYAPALGGWRFHQLLFDYRRYDNVLGPFTVAMRMLFFGRFGRDSEEFPIFLGTPELVRGYTSGSLRDHECLSATGGYPTGCDALNQLIGTRVAVFNAELRFPLTRTLTLGFAPIGLPPLEGAVFFDAGVAWDDRSSVGFSRPASSTPDLYRVPLTSWGFSIRANMFGLLIMRFDYAQPLSRDDVGAYWTISLGPTF
jgi:Tol biopolymer transport system component